MDLHNRFVNFLAVALVLISCGLATGQELAGRWDAGLKCPGGSIKFGLELNNDSEKWIGWLINGEERIRIPVVESDGHAVVIKIDHYDSVLRLKLDKSRLVGTWKKRRGLSNWVELECVATKHKTIESDRADRFLGRWQVKFSDSQDPAVAIFQKSKTTHEVLGTFLTTTGDYRFLAGNVVNGKLAVSCFDGAHAFLFRASVQGDGDERTLKGDFWSSNTWHETWTAKHDDKAKLPDSFKQTVVTDSAEDLGKLRFPDLDGNLTSLNDQKFAGKARIIYVFGSWCPNCHDAGKYFSELEQKYGDKGLSILGLAFELTGDFERDAKQVRKYLKRQGSTYPVLIAGVNDKADATKRLTILDRVRSYPTTIFLNAKGKVKAVHTGFTGPATGKAYDELRAEFERLIEGLLED